MAPYIRFFHPLQRGRTLTSLSALLRPHEQAATPNVTYPQGNARFGRTTVGFILIAATALVVGCQRPAGAKAPASTTAASSATAPRAAVPSAAVPSATVPSAAVPSAAVPSATVPSAAVPSAAVPSMSDVARDKTDKGPNGHNFTDLYERFFGAWRHDPIRLFEIGIAGGGSLRLWNEYFDKASIFAIDIVDSKQYENARTRTFVADQSNRKQLAKAMADFGGEFDFMLDDGGHGMALQQTSLGFLFKYVKVGGYYVIEDLHTSLTNRYPGGGYGADPDGENTTLRMLERYIDGMPPKFTSKYLLPSESAYLDEHVESLVISFRHDREHSMVCLIRKR
jgi:hypothetical protein